MAQGSGTTLGRAYIQIMPTTKGIKEALTNEMSDAGESAGRSGGSSLIGMIKGMIITAGLGKVMGAALSEGAGLEQSIGGIETLFKSSADTMQEYAAEAYKTTGLSANEYMQNVTGFSASLLQSLGGDTAKAAEVANQAMIDMSDNSNKMGTSMELIQNAYQGFAKQNYTMLDNLKLGYGGTKQEMERLLADAEKISGVHYDINNLSDVYNAIHVIQGELDITGTTAKEASTTFSGSFNSMKAAAKDLLGNIMLGNDVTPQLENLTQSVITFAGNLLPAVTNILSALPTTILQLVLTLGPQLITALLDTINQILASLAAAMPTLIPMAVTAITTIIQALLDNLPLIIDAGLQLIVALGQGLIDALPQLVEQIPVIITSIIAAITESLPLIISAGITLFTSLIGALPDIITAIVEALPEIISSIISAITDNLPLIISAGVQLFVALITNLPQIIAAVVGAIPDIIEGIVTGFGDYISTMAGIGLSLIQGLWEGISDAAGWIMDKISGFVDGIVSGIKGFFGIHSPSTVFAGIGKFLDMGLAQGIESNIAPINKAMAKIREATTEAIEADANVAMTVKTTGIDQYGDYALISQGERKSPVVNQTFIINSPVDSPAEIGRAIRRKAVVMGLAGEI